MIWREVWSCRSKCAEQKAKHQWDMDKTWEYKLHVRRRNVDDNCPGEVEEFDAMVQNARKKPHFPVENRDAMRHTSAHPDRRGTDAESCGVKRWWGETPWHRAKGGAL